MKRAQIPFINLFLLAGMFSMVSGQPEMIGIPSGDPVIPSAPIYGYEVLNVFPHDSSAYTQGLIIDGQFFYEGTGLYGGSSLRKVVVATGAILKQFDLANEYFGEGITALRDTIYQLTWLNQIGFVYVERDTFQLVKSFPYIYAGWGLTHNDTYLIASDGTPTIHFLNPSTQEVVSKIVVRDDGVPVNSLNELEFIQGRIFSNVYGSDLIAVIDSGSGDVDAWIDLSGLRDSVAASPNAGVLNGIAFDQKNLRVYVTGKCWPKIFEIDLGPLHPTDVEEVAVVIGEPSFPLSSHPNPCNRHTEIRFAARGDSYDTLSLCDLQGRRIRTFLDGRINAGVHSFMMDVNGIPAGIYFVRYRSGKMIGSCKILVMK